jgi:hypothetical protein
MSSTTAIQSRILRYCHIQIHADYFVGTRFLGAEAKFYRDNNTRTDSHLTSLCNSPCHCSLWESNQIGKDIRIQQIAKRHFQSSGSSRGDRVANKESSRPFLMGSTIRRPPSLRMIASSPSSSNTRGMRTAWFLPLRNRRTCRSVCGIPKSFDKFIYVEACATDAKLPNLPTMHVSGLFPRKIK